jgi:tRNA pseudouridine55 synthase
LTWTGLEIDPSLPTLLISKHTLAITKPTGISSGQVIRDLQEHFGPSKLFAPWLDAERSKRKRENQTQKKRRRDKGPIRVKIGHGGTLDPLATGVLITGIGTGTKRLSQFLECTKTYEAVVLFGASTDSFDRLGKILEKAPYSHITKGIVESALANFRGDIMQKPPIYSALKVQGKKMYEYAREGRELPVEIVARPVTVTELEIMDYMEGGTHSYRWPQDIAEPETRVIANQVLRKVEGDSAENKSLSMDEDTITSSELGQKRKRSNEPEGLGNGESKTPRLSSSDAEPSALKQSEDSTTATNLDGEVSPPTIDPCADGSMSPAVKLRMTVSSGFYVRSLCDDLGKAIGSLAFMTELSRSRQGDYELGNNVLEYDDLRKGEDVWGPKVEKLILGKESTPVVEDEAIIVSQDNGGQT